VAALGQIHIDVPVVYAIDLHRPVSYAIDTKAMSVA
jgi:hypothetical protein